MTKRKNKSYTTEFKQEAASLGITTKLIYNWKAKLEEQQAGNSLNEDERAELKRLRKESFFAALCG